jgi:hypothetical protein
MESWPANASVGALVKSSDQASLLSVALMS